MGATIEIPDLRRDNEEFQARFWSGVAEETTKVLRNKNSLWPVDTGFSKSRFLAEETGKAEVTATNTADYAEYVERRGRPAFSTIKKNLNKIIAAARKQASDG